MNQKYINSIELKEVIAGLLEKINIESDKKLNKSDIRLTSTRLIPTIYNDYFVGSIDGNDIYIPGTWVSEIAHDEIRLHISPDLSTFSPTNMWSTTSTLYSTGLQLTINNKVSRTYIPNLTKKELWADLHSLVYPFSSTALYFSKTINSSSGAFLAITYQLAINQNNPTYLSNKLTKPELIDISSLSSGSQAGELEAYISDSSTAINIRRYYCVYPSYISFDNAYTGVSTTKNNYLIPYRVWLI